MAPVQRKKTHKIEPESFSILIPTNYDQSRFFLGSTHTHLFFRKLYWLPLMSEVCYWVFSARMLRSDLISRWLLKCPHYIVMCQTCEREEKPLTIRCQHLISLLGWLWHDKKQNLTTAMASLTHRAHNITKIKKGKCLDKLMNCYMFLSFNR